MSRQSVLMFSQFAVWTEPMLQRISASAKPCWTESDRHRFVWAGGGFTTGLTSTAGWMTISHEGGP